MTASWDCTARIWNAETGLPVTPPLAHAYPVFHAVFSSDGTRVITGSREMLAPAVYGAGEAHIWRVTDGQLLAALPEQTTAVTDVRFSRDGTRVLTARGNQTTVAHTARLWDARTGQPLGQALPHPNGVNCVLFSPDERWVVTGCVDGLVRVWDAATGRHVWSAARHPQRGIGTLSFSPDGRLLVTSSADGTARLWDWATAEPVSPPLWHGDSVYHLMFSPSGHNLLIQGGSHARLWEVAPDLRSIEELIRICELSAGVHLDETGARQPLSPEELLAALRQLQVKYPEEFGFKPPPLERLNGSPGPD